MQRLSLERWQSLQNDGWSVLTRGPIPCSVFSRGCHHSCLVPVIPRGTLDGKPHVTCLWAAAAATASDSTAIYIPRSPSKARECSRELKAAEAFNPSKRRVWQTSALEGADAAGGGGVLSLTADLLVSRRKRADGGVSVLGRTWANASQRSLTCTSTRAPLQ